MDFYWKKVKAQIFAVCFECGKSIKEGDTCMGGARFEDVCLNCFDELIKD